MVQLTRIIAEDPSVSDSSDGGAGDSPEYKQTYIGECRAEVENWSQRSRTDGRENSACDEKTNQRNYHTDTSLPAFDWSVAAELAKNRDCTSN